MSVFLFEKEYCLLEPCEGKLSRTVLRGESTRKGADLPDPVGLRTTLKLDVKHPERSVRRVGTELKFTTSQGDVIEPLYNIHRQRYVVYWDLEKE